MVLVIKEKKEKSKVDVKIDKVPVKETKVILKKSSKQQKFLKKPKGGSVQGISSTKTLSRFAHTTGPVVREVEQREVVQDNRSQFFKDEFIKEERSANKWLG